VPFAVAAFGIHDGFTERGRQTIPAADDAEPHAFSNAVGRFRKKVFVKQPQNPLDLHLGTLPIRGGEREKRQCVNAHAGSGTQRFGGLFQRRPDGRPNGAVPLKWPTGRCRPR